MIKEIGYCHGIENYSRHLSGRAAGRAAADAARLPAGRRADHRRREPPDRAAGAGHVSRRSIAQGSARRVRVPAAVGARQPAAELRGVGSARRAGRLRQRHARARTSCGRRAASSSSRSSGRPDWSIRSIDIRPVGGQVDDLLGEIRTVAARGRARARDDADEADGRGPDAVLPGAGRAGAVSAFGYRYARARADPARPAARRRSTCSSASTCCARASTCPKCRWSRFSTPTRRASCARRAR